MPIGDRTSYCVAVRSAKNRRQLQSINGYSSGIPIGQPDWTLPKLKLIYFWPSSFVFVATYRLSNGQTEVEYVEGIIVCRRYRSDELSRKRGWQIY